MTKHKRPAPRDEQHPNATSGADDVASLINERRKIEEWIDALEAKREQTPVHVFTRVHADYDKRLKDVASRLAAHKGSLAEEQSGLRKKLAVLDERIQQHKDERAEIELRAHVGELTGGAVDEAYRIADERLAQLLADRSAIEADLGRVTAFFAAADGGKLVAPSGPASAASRGSGGRFDELSFLQSVVGGPRQQTHPEPVHQPGPTRPEERPSVAATPTPSIEPPAPTASSAVAAPAASSAPAPAVVNAPLAPPPPAAASGPTSVAPTPVPSAQGPAAARAEAPRPAHTGERPVAVESPAQQRTGERVAVTIESAVPKPDVAKSEPAVPKPDVAKSEPAVPKPDVAKSEPAAPKPDVAKSEADKPAKVAIEKDEEPLADKPPQRAPRATIAMQQASMTFEPEDIAPGNGILRADEATPSLLDGISSRAQTGEKPFAANVASNNPLSLKSSAPTEVKTLKCRECGAMNDPTEWYCERCGAELSAL